MNNFIVGKKYEALAQGELSKLGYEILMHNFKCKIGEIDLIYKDNGTYVFAEVKYRKSTSFMNPLEAITPKKIRNIKLTAQYFLKLNCLYDVNIRFDAIEIIGEDVRIIKDAF